MPKKSKAVKKRLLALHRPNLDLPGPREPNAYGQEALAGINHRLIASARGDLAVGTICGPGAEGCDFALQFGLQ